MKDKKVENRKIRRYFETVNTEESHIMQNGMERKLKYLVKIIGQKHTRQILSYNLKGSLTGGSQLEYTSLKIQVVTFYLYIRTVIF